MTEVEMIEAHHKFLQSPDRDECGRIRKWSIKFLAILLIYWGTTSFSSATFISAPSLAAAAAESKLVLRVLVLEEGRVFNMSGSSVFKICRCKIIRRFKTSERLPESVILEAEEIFIACSAKDQFGTLKKGDDSIVFCISGGFAPTVLNGGYIYKVESDRVAVRIESLPGSSPEEKGSSLMDVEKFQGIVESVVGGSLKDSQ